MLIRDVCVYDLKSLPPTVQMTTAHAINRVQSKSKYNTLLISVLQLGDDMVTSPSNLSMHRNHSAAELQLNSNDSHKANTHFMKKIPPGAEASNILVGEVEFLEKTLSAFVRLNEAAIMGDLTEVPVPTR